MVACSAGKETLYRVDTGPALPGEGVFTNWRMPDGRLVVSMRRDVYEAALEAANTVLRRIMKEKEYLKP
ncbi:hypothetical protein [Pedomonas sp. V897]|uniref:hypothetical protein n=1 Tax=Pedomonas sp. V897 TaxID=3446482 RepID=UPI003EE1F603